MQQIPLSETRRDPMVPGRWYPSDKPEHEWLGVCAKCGAITAAVTLELKRLPWGRGEQWQCKGGCC